MVFTTNPEKRHRGNKGKARQQKEGLLTIAPELLLQIVEDDCLSTQDILNLRLAHRALTPTCNTVLAAKLNILYVHPSTTSLRRAVEVCRHPLFSRGIEEVVLLGLVDWRAINRYWPGYRKVPGSREEERKQDWEREGVTLFRCWPLTYPPPDSKARKAGEVDDSTEAEEVDVSTFAAAYAPLLKALGNLPSLKKLSFGQPNGPGYNQITRDQLETHSQMHHNPTNAERMAKGSRQRWRYAWADADAFFALLFHPNLAGVTGVALDTELPYLPLRFNTSQRQRLGTLRNVDVAFDHGQKPVTKWQKLWRRVLQLAEGLEELRVAWKGNASYKKAEDEWALRSLLSRQTEDGKSQFVHWPKLKVLEIVGLPAALSRAHLAKLRKAAEKDWWEYKGPPPQRPICLLLDMPAFLLLHAKSLERVRFKNTIFFNPQDATDGKRLVDHISAVIGALEECTKSSVGKLHDVSWTINKFEHEQRCSKALKGQCQGAGKYDCGVYSSECKEGNRVLDLKMKAEELEPYVQLEEEGGFWEFGEKVMAFKRDTEGWTEEQWMEWEGGVV